MNNDHRAIWDCFWLFPLHFRNIISNCLTIVSSYLSTVWRHELLILTAISVATSLGYSHFVMMLDNEKSQEMDLQFLSKTPFSSCLKSFLRGLSISSAASCTNEATASLKMKTIVRAKNIFAVTICKNVDSPCRCNTFYKIMLQNPWCALLLLLSYLWETPYLAGFFTLKQLCGEFQQRWEKLPLVFFTEYTITPNRK